MRDEMTAETIEDVPLTEDAASTASVRTAIEEHVWRWTEWRGGADQVSELLVLVERYADARCRETHGMGPVERFLTSARIEPGFRGSELVEISLVDAAVNAGVMRRPDVDEKPGTVRYVTADEVVTDPAAEDTAEWLKANATYVSRSRKTDDLIYDGPEPRTRSWVLGTGEVIRRTWEPRKVCLGCEREKDIDEFTFNRERKDGRETQCKKCRNHKKRSVYPSG